MFTVLLPLVLLVNGIAAGVLVSAQLGAWPLLAGLPADRYVSVHAFLSARYDRFMPASLTGLVLGGVALAVLVPDPAVRPLFVVAALAALTTIVVSLTKNVPVIRWVRGLDPDRLPADFATQDRRRSWGAWNRVRVGLVVFALSANCVAVALML